MIEREGGIIYNHHASATSSKLEIYSATCDCRKFLRAMAECAVCNMQYT